MCVSFLPVERRVSSHFPSHLPLGTLNPANQSLPFPNPCPPLVFSFSRIQGGDLFLFSHHSHCSFQLTSPLSICLRSWLGNSGFRQCEIVVKNLITLTRCNTLVIHSGHEHKTPDLPWSSTFLLIKLCYKQVVDQPVLIGHFPLVAKNKHYQLQPDKTGSERRRLKGDEWKKYFMTVSWTDDTKRPQNAFGELTRQFLVDQKKILLQYMQSSRFLYQLLRSSQS